MPQQERKGSMREIKFRVWTGSGMEYQVVAGNLGAFYAPGLDPKDTACISPFNTLYPKATPIMQFTGLHDKNGKEIYEGDILFEEVREYQGAVVFDDGCFQVKFENIIENLSECLDWEVIGNIYENGDLLK